MTPPPIEPSAITWKTPGAAGYGALLLVVIGLIVTGRTLLPAIVAATVSDEVAEAEEFDPQKQHDAFASDLETWVATAQGRSVFFIPPKPIIEEVIVDEGDDQDENTTTDPVKPRTYGGKKIIAAMNGRIWLDDGTIIPLGEEAQGVKLVHLDNLPWTARVEWREVEFDVDIFENTTGNFLSTRGDGE